ncbi:hypothetical protein ACFQES_47175 [Nonomuraea salmonea]|uniref:hypothetical protein n=1 Tax=Nonomuraea TaxID=83681 RepID=UPI00341420E8
MYGSRVQTSGLGTIGQKSPAAQLHGLGTGAAGDLGPGTEAGGGILRQVPPTGMHRRFDLVDQRIRQIHGGIVQCLRHPTHHGLVSAESQIEQVHRVSGLNTALGRLADEHITDRLPAAGLVPFDRRHARQQPRQMCREVWPIGILSDLEPFFGGGPRIAVPPRRR